MPAVVLEGQSHVDESMITGEAAPVRKAEGDMVLGSSLNQGGVLYVRVCSLTHDNALAQIAELVEKAQMSRAPIQVCLHVYTYIHICTPLCSMLYALCSVFYTLMLIHTDAHSYTPYHTPITPIHKYSYSPYFPTHTHTHTHTYTYTGNG